MSINNHSNNNGANTNVSMISNATQYIVRILVQYQKLNDTRLEQKEKQVTLNELLNINVVELIDNFNLVLDESTSHDAFETTYHMILYQINNLSTENIQSLSNSARAKLFSDSSCTVSICKMLQRNNRDRIAGYAMSQVYYGVKDETQIIILQLLDKMHCYFMHSFDVCLKWTKRETNYIYSSAHTDICMEPDPMLQRIKANIDQKKQNISKTSARLDDNRYVTTIHNEEQKKTTEDHHESTDKKESKNSSHPHQPHHTTLSTADSSPYPFTFGKRWRYSKKYATSEAADPKNGGKYNEWFVSQKYTNLKREILSNALKKIPMLQWNHINNKAEQFMKCNRIKQLRAAKDINYGFDGKSKDSMANIAQNECITLQHIICILIYCNFSSIKNSLTDTYNPMNKYEQWKDVRSKHSEYANFARILTETIECFGDTPLNNQERNKFYHCVLGAFELHSLNARFFVPTSMTQQLSVITYYCYNTINLERYSDGLIIGLSAIHADLKCFNCSFLSDFTNEFEVIFLGGKNTLRFNSIYDIKKMHNYQYYLSAIQMIEECFINYKHSTHHTHHNININNPLLFAAFKQCICNQTQETPCVPPQIDYYLNSWCISRKSITVHLTLLTQNVYVRQLLTECQLLTPYDEGTVYCIYIDSLCRLFPNATTINLIEPMMDKKGEIFTQFYQFLDSQMFYSLELTEIRLISPTFIGIPVANANDVIQAQLPRYFQSGWTIQMPPSSIANNLQQNQPGSPAEYIIKRLAPQQQKHHKSQSSPNALTNEDPFGGKVQQMNKSSGHILSDGGGSELFENDSNVTDVTGGTGTTANTVPIHIQKALTPVLIKLRMKSPHKDHKDMNIEFVFNPDDSPPQVANDMVQELGLPPEYLEAVIHTIHQCISEPQYTATNIGGMRSRTSSSVSTSANSNVIVSFTCGAYSEPVAPATLSDEGMSDNNKQENAAQLQPSSSSSQPGQQQQQQQQQPGLNVIHENQQGGNDEKHKGTNELKRALQQQQQNMIKQKHVTINDNLPVTHIMNQYSAPQVVNNNNNSFQSQSHGSQSQSSPHIFNAQPPAPAVAVEPEEQSIFQTPLVLHAFDRYAFPSSSVQLLDGKKNEFHTEYRAFLKTQSQIFDLKLEHIQIEDGSGNYENERQSLVKSMEEKIELKRKELTGKWEEFVQDQRELNELKQQISAKHLVQFKQQLHFENQSEYQQILNSDKISKSDKEQFRGKLKDFRDKMIEEYKAFRESHYGKYDNKLKQIQQTQTQALQQQSAMQYVTPQ